MTLSNLDLMLFSDLNNIKLSYVNFPYGRLLRDKLVFSIYFKDFCNVPELYAYINSGKIYSVNKKHPAINFNEILDILKSKKIILKPRFGTAGQGIYKVENSGEDIIINNKIYNTESFKNFIFNLRDYIAVEFITQSRFSESFFNKSVNTIRITTFANPETGEGKILYALMRFGRDKSAPADNVGTGGIYSLIDTETGKLRKAIELLDYGNFKYHDHHPDTQTPVTNILIPRWQTLKDELIDLATLIHPYIKFAGWDIILTDDDYYLIEGNNGPDLYIQGPDNPLKSNSDFKDFFAKMI